MDLPEKKRINILTNIENSNDDREPVAWDSLSGEEVYSIRSFSKASGSRKNIHEGLISSNKEMEEEEIIPSIRSQEKKKNINISPPKNSLKDYLVDSIDEKKLNIPTQNFIKMSESFSPTKTQKIETNDIGIEKKNFNNNGFWIYFLLGLNLLLFFSQIIFSSKIKHFLKSPSKPQIQQQKKNTSIKASIILLSNENLNDYKIYTTKTTPQKLIISFDKKISDSSFSVNDPDKLISQTDFSSSRIIFSLKENIDFEDELKEDLKILEISLFDKKESNQ